MSTGTLTHLQNRWTADVDATIETHLVRADLDEQLLTMIRYQLGYVDALGAPSDIGSGKRFRPLLCVKICEAVGGTASSAMIAAAAIELVHNFSLIHDDIEDRDPARRHRPTVWKVWGEPQAINAGDAMFALAGTAALHSSPHPTSCIQVGRRFLAMTLELTRGQFLDMSFEERLDVTTDEYMRMIDGKSAALVAFATWSGAVMGGASTERASALEKFGKHLGRAFQIEDDILGIWASTEVTGKEAAKDLQSRKKTLPVLLAVAAATDGDALALRRYLTRADDDIKTVTDILSRTNARDNSEVQLQQELAAARSALRDAGLDAQDYAELLALMADITRQTTGGAGGS